MCNPTLTVFIFRLLLYIKALEKKEILAKRTIYHLKNACPENNIRMW